MSYQFPGGGSGPSHFKRGSGPGGGTTESWKPRPPAGPKAVWIQYLTVNLALLALYLLLLLLFPLTLAKRLGGLKEESFSS